MGKSKLVTGVVIICVLLLLFNFMPTGTSDADIISGYKMTQSYATSNAQLYSSYDFVTAAKMADPEQDPLVRSTREKIVNFGIYMADTFGAGYLDEDEHPTTKLWYCGVNSKTRTAYCHFIKADGTMCKNTSVHTANGYGKRETWINNLNAVLNNEVDAHMHGSCAGYATFCISYIAPQVPVKTGTYGIGNTYLGADYATNVTKVRGSELSEKAKPGDILLKEGHTMLYLGTVTCPNGTVWERALTDMSWDDPDSSNCRIKPVGEDTEYHVVPLTKIIEICYGSQYTPEEDMGMPDDVDPDLLD